ncbi:hypothetical protein RD792_017649 [Penstemon davidsonii]|uniref:Uncharacterized protein n=1 Tax=Penstemon davidsonii TaxID=160366 RepID=A0ABR0CMS2_9LAMI|nr:hypothetical protein RD792_017649 [Penstemon davidsonii]
MNSVQPPPIPTHQYPQAIQLKLYQAFIFSIPVLFSIILFLLFYLFYLKRTANSTITSPILPRSTINDSSITRPSDSDLKTELKNKMYAVLFDDYMKARDSLAPVASPGPFQIQLSIPPANSTPEINTIEFESNHHQLHCIGSTSSGGGSTSSSC